MKAAAYLTELLIRQGVTDVFGVPGGVVLDLLYALEARRPEICPHLCFHEQAAGFAASGFAQAGGSLGAAYATRGPGFTNLLTPMADAWQESLPVLFVTAHGNVPAAPLELRVAADQELDAVSLAGGIVKYAARVDRPEDFRSAAQAACRAALTGRPGPVLLDVAGALWRQDVGPAEWENSPPTSPGDPVPACAALKAMLAQAKRPVILAGRGVRQSGTVEQVLAFAQARQIPLLTSRGAQDLFPDSPLYFGYIGSRGLRYSNFILSKADFLLVLGNRMAFPPDSRSFAPILRRAGVFRVEVDPAELARPLSRTAGCPMDLRSFFAHMAPAPEKSGGSAWFSVCQKLRDRLWDRDAGEPVPALAALFHSLPEAFSIVSDVGDHEFWVSRAYALAGTRHRVLYSQSFGALGCALPKSIGVHFQTGGSVLCIAGDQGLQMNIQELQFIAANRIPVVILLLNNHASGMIRGREQKLFEGRTLHTTPADGYSAPDFRALARAYGLPYRRLPEEGDGIFTETTSPLFLELEVPMEARPEPVLPPGEPCQDMRPALDRALYEELNAL